MNATMTMADYVRANQITVTVTQWRGPQVDDDGWEHNAYTLRLDSPVLSPGKGWEDINWHQGPGICVDPESTPVDVFDALVSDATSVETTDGFEDWAAEMGYNPDSRKAEEIYRACVKVRDQLVDFLGGRDEFEKVAYQVERP